MTTVTVVLCSWTCEDNNNDSADELTNCGF